MAYYWVIMTSHFGAIMTSHFAHYEKKLPHIISNYKKKMREGVKVERKKIAIFIVLWVLTLLFNLFFFKASGIIRNNFGQNKIKSVIVTSNKILKNYPDILKSDFNKFNIIDVMIDS